MIEMEMYSDYACPWCYFLIPDIRKLMLKDNVYIRRRAFQILPKIPLDGISVEQYDQLRGNTDIDRQIKDNLTIDITNRKNLPWVPRKKFY
ncbi:DsbA family protein [Francisella sp. SYW-9]|uniref:DsbA family protein n=1 Tax=Francisella sp. SYW-9 TaxID=2610888 RepID=UPI00123D7676|nr:DsbA family protein [Francisella sp. SYW-9]